MGQISTIKLNREFSLIFRRGERVHTRTLILNYMPRRKQNCLRLGVTVSRSVRSAVKRNRMKRLLREAFRNEAMQLKQSYDIVLTAKDKVPPAGYTEIVSDLRYALKRSGLYADTADERGQTSE